MSTYQAAFYSKQCSPLYNGEPFVTAFEVNADGVVIASLGWRTLPEQITDPSDAYVADALGELGFDVYHGPSGPAIVADGTGWRMLLAPRLANVDDLVQA